MSISVLAEKELGETDKPSSGQTILIRRSHMRCNLFFYKEGLFDVYKFVSSVAFTRYLFIGLKACLLCGSNNDFVIRLRSVIITDRPTKSVVF